MIIAIDGYEANTYRRVGIGQYAYQIIRHIHTMLHKERNHSNTRVRVYLPENPFADFPECSDRWEYKVCCPKRFWTFFALPIHLFFDRPSADVVFSPTHYMPRYIHHPRVVAIMDLSFLFFQTLFRPKDYYQLLHGTKYSVNHARAICTISEFTRDAIIQAYQYPKDRIFVTYPGFSMNKKNVQKNKRKTPYILSVGTLQPRKNYERLIEAFSLLKEFDGQLVIVGKRGWLYESILSAPNRYGVEDRVVFLDFVPDEELPSLYKNAVCFALPSLYEGFGLPVLEAMAYECPVVISNVSSLPEIAGEAGIYVDPNDVESIADGLRKAITEDNTKRIQQGLKRVQLFSWETAAKQTLDILERVGRGEL